VTTRSIGTHGIIGHSERKENGELRARAALWLCAVAAVCAGCGGSDSPAGVEGDDPLAASDTDDGSGTAAAPEDGPSALALRIARDGGDADALRGGRLYDNFYSENPAVGFAPEVEGGPFGDGTLPDSGGEVVANDVGHGYRLKNFFGWDLRGADGIYGPGYQDKAYVARYNLLGGGAGREDVARLIVDGAPGVPAYGQVLPEADLADIVAFVMAVREHELPRPDDIWQLDADAPSGYVLAAGASIDDGQSAIGASCAGCHGADGTNILFDDGEFSLGTLARASGYEVWFKIVAGNPGSPMLSQLPRGEPVAQAKMVLDVLAALCDQTAFPPGGASEPDVPAGDPRCGRYLR
jgi:mono/diheme cytochrome c family protein